MSIVKDKICVVTGGASGIGSAVVQTLAANGAIVVATDRFNPQTEFMAGLPQSVEFVLHDVTIEDQWKSLIAHVVGKYGRIDVLVNNAGVTSTDSLENETLDNWRKVQAVNVEGVFLGCKYGVQAMRDSGGSIINLSSTVVHQPQSFNISYAASKGAVDALTRSVAVYCMERDYPVRCNSMQPHAADTPLLRQTLSTVIGSDDEASKVAGTMKLGTASAVANAIMFLASDASSDINGSALTLDRGARIMLAASPN